MKRRRTQLSQEEMGAKVVVVMSKTCTAPINQVTVIGVAKRTRRACAVRGNELAANGWAEGHARLLG